MPEMSENKNKEEELVLRIKKEYEIHKERGPKRSCHDTEGQNKKKGKTLGFLFLRQYSLAFSLYTTWACQGRLSLVVDF